MKFCDFKERRSFSLKQVVPVLRQAGLNDKADIIANCGAFKHIAVCNDCGTAHFNGASSCKDRFCPICQKKRSLSWFRKVTPIMHDYISKGYLVNMLNFTIKDMDNLEEAINLLNKAFRYMTHDNKRTATIFNAKFIGGIRSMEVIRGANSGKWHPHFHCMVIKKRFSQDFEFLKNAWEQALCTVSGNRFTKLGSVYVQAFSAENNKGIETAICETFKYMTKFNWKAVDVCELVETMKDRCSIFTWGCLRSALKDFNENEELNKNLTELEDCVCRTCGSDSFTLYENVLAEHIQLEDFVHPSDYYTELFYKYGDIEYAGI